MGRFFFYGVQFYFFIWLVTITHGQGDSARGPKRTKVSPYAGLVPFLRTGRSRFHQQSKFPEPIYNEDFNFQRTKPYGALIAFPRVGRSETAEGWGAQKKDNNNNNNMNSGLWFGPRLGRISKRQEYKQNIPMAYLYFDDYIPRLGRESEEILENADNTREEPDSDKSVIEAV